MQKLKIRDTFTEFDKDYDYLNGNAEAVVYFIFRKSRVLKANLFVMKRYEAAKFCSRKETKGPSWALCFSTHKRNWRNELKLFKRDDGRFSALLEELNIIPMYRKTD